MVLSGGTSTARRRLELAAERSKSLIVIPARMRSERLPGKPLMTAGGKSLVHWTYLQAKGTEADLVVVATGDREIVDHCLEKGIECVLTKDDHPNGSSRCLEVLRTMRDEHRIRVVLDWQCDEPCVRSEDANRLLTTKVNSIQTLVLPPTESNWDMSAWSDPNEVKVVFSKKKCHWFSRKYVPGSGIHVGVYAFSPILLELACSLPISDFARLERLEQLTWIEDGFLIEPVEVEDLPLSINSERDWADFARTKEKR